MPNETITTPDTSSDTPTATDCTTRSLRRGGIAGLLGSAAFLATGVLTSMV